MNNPLEDPNFTTTPPPPLPAFHSPFATNAAPVLDNPFNAAPSSAVDASGFSSSASVIGADFETRSAPPAAAASAYDHDDDAADVSGQSHGAVSADEESTGGAGGLANSAIGGKPDFPVNVDERLNPYSKLQTRPCCGTDRAFRSVSPNVFNPLLTSDPLDQQDKPAITISDAVKTSEGAGSSYIAYVIRTDIPSIGLHLEAKHRYSDFESLQRFFRRIHPTIVVPPVPEKHTVADYAARPGKAKEDPKIIENRKRTLQSFLNRVAAHPILGKEHVLHRFIDGQGGSWTDILMDSGMAHFMKKKDPASGLKLTDSLLKNPDPHFLASEDYTYRFGIQLGNIIKYHKRIVKHYADMAAVGSDLGAAYNGWSLTETGPTHALAHAVEAVGEAVDNTVSATSQLVLWMDDKVTDPLNEYDKLTKQIDKILRWRHSKHVAFEQVSETLDTKRQALIKLEASELESQRLQAVLHAEGTSGPATARVAASVASNPYATGRPTGAAGGGGEAEGAGAGFNGVTSSATITSSYVGPSRSTSGGGLLATLNSFIDNDPEATRRANITKTRDRIGGLEQERRHGLAELGAANESIQRDLDRFQRDKVHDLRNMLLAYALAHRELCKKSLSAWQDAKASIEAVDVSR
ncbi:Sorting nexin, cytoplasm-to-vacuole targeting pathway/endosomal sorting [Phlyctochytrium bullatum]|nr:Sorting nexin, cytoplasm-to-vacuole targeting pathway/endosomal sorting [Phlyctochytrium bullatum]